MHKGRASFVDFILKTPVLKEDIFYYYILRQLEEEEKLVKHDCGS